MNLAVSRTGGPLRSLSGRLNLDVRVVAAALVVAAAAAATAGCGKKGPPLPPFVRIPAAPGDIVASRLGDVVEIMLTLPSANLDGTRPADIERVDLLALTGPRSVTDAEILEHGVLIGSLDVKAPADPGDTIDPDEPLGDLEPLEGPGLDQGSIARLTEELTVAALQAIEPAQDDSQLLPTERILNGLPRVTPVIMPPMEVLSRTYVAIGVSTRGRRGAISGRAVVPLSPAPPAPGPPEVTYDEEAVTIEWTPVGHEGLSLAPALLPARVIAPVTPETMYSVYELPLPHEAVAEPSLGTRLTSAPVDGQSYVDSRIEWGDERCYAVRVVHRYSEGLTVEGDASSPTCLTLVDVFPPAAPTGVQSISSEGAIVLIWNPVSAADLAGYVILRGEPGSVLQPIAVPPVQEATFRDEVPSGSRFMYAVRAIDRAGNASDLSDTTEEVAR